MLNMSFFYTLPFITFLDYLHLRVFPALMDLKQCDVPQDKRTIKTPQKSAT